jgi:hypothetical protein
MIHREMMNHDSDTQTQIPAAIDAVQRPARRRRRFERLWLGIDRDLARTFSARRSQDEWPILSRIVAVPLTILGRG